MLLKAVRGERMGRGVARLGRRWFEAAEVSGVKGTPFTHECQLTQMASGCKQARLIGSRRALQKLWAGEGAEERVENGGSIVYMGLSVRKRCLSGAEGREGEGGGVEVGLRGWSLTALVGCLWRAIWLEGNVLHPPSLFVMLLFEAVRTASLIAVCLAGTSTGILLKIPPITDSGGEELA